MRQNTQGTFGNLGGSGDPPSLLIRKFTACDSNFRLIFGAYSSYSHRKPNFGVYGCPNQHIQHETDILKHEGVQDIQMFTYSQPLRPHSTTSLLCFATSSSSQFNHHSTFIAFKDGSRRVIHTGYFRQTGKLVFRPTAPRGLRDYNLRYRVGFF